MNITPTEHNSILMDLTLFFFLLSHITLKPCHTTTHTTMFLRINDLKTKNNLTIHGIGW